MITQNKTRIACAAVAGLLAVQSGLCQPVDPGESYSMRSKSKGVPVITKQPQDQYVKIGSSAGFTVSAKPEPLRYQWQLNCNTIPGATNKTYTIPHVTTNDVGNYFCLVSREPEVTMTQPATLMSFSTDTNGTTVAWVPPPGGAGPPGPGGCPVN